MLETRIMAKTRSTLIMDSELWKRFKMIAILNEMEVSELVEQALREKLERMKQLEQYPEYKDVRNLRVHKGEQPQQEEPVIHSSRYEAARSSPDGQHSNQSPQSYQGNSQDIFGKPIMAPLKNGQVEINLTIPELTFPTNKEKIQKILNKNIDWINQELALNKVPESREVALKLLDLFRMNLDIVSNLLMYKKVYKDVGEIEEEIIKAPKKRLADLHIKHRPEGTIGGCKIRYGPDIIKDRMGMRLIT